MLVAEVAAERAGKKLDFGDWEGNDAGKPWAKNVRKLIDIRDVDVGEESDYVDEHAEEVVIPKQKLNIPSESKTPAVSVTPIGYDSDDSLTGYASPGSSRSVSPTQSELDEIEKDPTLRVGIKKTSRPVYLAQLGKMLRGTGGVNSGEDNQEADKIELALNCAEELIRKKCDYGTELGTLAFFSYTSSGTLYIFPRTQRRTLSTLFMV
jgi:telomere length regulation protein